MVMRLILPHHISTTGSIRCANTSEAIGSGGSIDILIVFPTVEQTKWDGRDANAYALIALSVKCGIVPYIHSCKTAKGLGDALASLYHVRNAY